LVKSRICMWKLPLWVYQSLFHGKMGPTFAFRVYMS
jgi:hypothetical protein